MKFYLLLVIASCVSVAPAFAQQRPCKPDPLSRTRILGPDLANNFTCYMELRRGWFGVKYGTGMLIHPRVVLTAGHNTANYLTSKPIPFLFSKVKNATMYFGSIDETTFAATSSVRLKNKQNKFFKKWYSPKGSIDRDFSIIILPDSSVFNRLGGCYRIAAVSSVRDLGPELHITGSPGDKDLHEIWTAKTKNFGIDNDALVYDLYTEVRNSGSPVWIKSAKGPRVVGVHSREYDDNCNAAVLITPAVYDQIVAWCASAGITL